MDAEEQFKPVVYKNNFEQQTLIQLNSIKNLISTQLPQINPTIIVRIVFDESYQTIALTDTNTNEIVGASVCKFIAKLKICFIEYFAICQEKMRKGLGKILINQVKEEVRRRKYCEINVHADVFSIDFYVKNGFVEISKKQAKRWEVYFQQYLHTKPLSYVINDYTTNNQIIQSQIQSLKEGLSGLKYRQYNFRRQEINSLIEFLKNQKTNKPVDIIEPNITLQQQIIHLQKRSFLKAKVILKILKSNPFCWVIESPLLGKQGNNKFGILNYNELENLIYKEASSEICMRICSQIQKTVQVLNRELPTDSSTHPALKQLTKFIKPIMKQILSGTFNWDEKFKQYF